LNISDLLVDVRQRVFAMQRFRRLPRLIQELECLVEREHARGIARRPLRIRERTRQVPGLHEMVREILRMLVGARSRHLAVAHGRVVGLSSASPMRWCRRRRRMDSVLRRALRGSCRA
jgi:hypothetical protein